jgi:hypothetical protein
MKDPLGVLSPPPRQEVKLLMFLYILKEKPLQVMGGGPSPFLAQRLKCQ